MQDTGEALFPLQCQFDSQLAVLDVVMDFTGFQVLFFTTDDAAIRVRMLQFTFFTQFKIAR